MIYGNQTWLEIDDIDKEQAVVIVPLAALEQHGHHLPLLTDTYITTAIAEAVERQLPQQALLTPTLWCGASDHHLDFPGTISLPNSIYADVVQSICTSILSAGFEKILLLNGHGGNVAPGTAAITELVADDDDCDDSYIAFASFWVVAADELRPEKHGMTQDGFSHACEYETSMMLHLHGELVALSKAQGNVMKEYDSVPGLAVASRFHRRTATGAMGSPELGTAEKGESLVAAGVAKVVELVQKMSPWPTKPVLGPLSN